MVDGPNTYGFCGGDPVNRVDPMGLCYDEDGVWDYHCGVEGHDKGPTVDDKLRQNAKVTLGEYSYWRCVFGDLSPIFSPRKSVAIRAAYSKGVNDILSANGDTGTAVTMSILSDVQSGVEGLVNRVINPISGFCAQSADIHDEYFGFKEKGVGAECAIPLIVGSKLPFVSWGIKGDEIFGSGQSANGVDFGRGLLWYEKGSRGCFMVAEAASGAAGGLGALKVDCVIPNPLNRLILRTEIQPQACVWKNSGLTPPSEWKPALPQLTTADEVGLIWDLEMKLPPDMPGNGLRIIDHTTVGGSIRRVLGNGQLASFSGEVDMVITNKSVLVVGRGHSVLSRGATVPFAGTLRFNSKGLCVRLTNNSGHFLTPGELLVKAKEYLSKTGVDTSKMVLEDVAK